MYFTITAGKNDDFLNVLTLCKENINSCLKCGLHFNSACFF